MSKFIPESPRNIAIRPLDGGVVNNVSPGQVPKGAFLQLLNYRVGTDGLSRRPAWIREETVENFVEYPPLQNVWVMWDTSGVKRTVFADQKFLYIPSTDSNGTITTSKLATTNEASTTGVSVTVDSSDMTAVTGTGTDFLTNDIRVGDVIYINGATGHTISQVSDATHLNVRSGTADAHHEFTVAATGASFEILEGFYDTDLVEVEISGTTHSIGNVPYIDATMTGQEMIFADGYRPLRRYDPGAATSYADFSAASFAPVCIAYYRDRIFAGQILTSGSEFYRQRVRWSEATDAGWTSWPAVNYVDLPYQSGGLWRLVTFARMLAAFFDDAIYIGRPTSSSSLPVNFEKIETGGVGLVAMRGITSWMDSLFFTGKDNIYMLTASEVRPVGTPAVKRALRELGQTDKYRIMGYSDTVEGKIGFAFPQPGTGVLTHCWEMDIETGAWSKLDFGDREVGFIKEASLAFAVTIDGFADTITIDSMAGRIDNYTSTLGERRLYLGIGGGVNFLSFASADESDVLDYGSQPLGAVTVTGDMDLDLPDTKKLWNRLTVKLTDQTDPAGGDILLRVKGSVDRGQNWKALGWLRITAGTDEGKVNFRLLGAQARFQLELAGNEVGEFTVTEMVLRAKGRGQELRFE